MERGMPDGIHSDVGILKRTFPDPPLIAGYGTGSQSVRWENPDWSLWPNSIHVMIDQGGAGGPIDSATVRDVESGAWTVDAAVNLRGWNAERPTIYCSRNTLADVIRAGWHGDVWLAWPGYSARVPPVQPGVNIVAVQHTYATNFDLSSVFDDAWPFRPRTEEEMIYVQLGSGGSEFIPFPAGSFKQVILYRDFVNAERSAVVRVAYLSASKGYEIAEVTLSESAPQVIEFKQGDVHAVSLVNQSNIWEVGVTLA